MPKFWDGPVEAWLAAVAAVVGGALFVAGSLRDQRAPVRLVAASADDGLEMIAGPPEVIAPPPGWWYPSAESQYPPEAPSAAVLFLHTNHLRDFSDRGTWGLLYDYHRDDHRSPGVVKWHPGVSILVRTSR